MCCVQKNGKQDDTIEQGDPETRRAKWKSEAENVPVRPEGGKYNLFCVRG